MTRPITVAHRAGNDAALLASAAALGVDLLETDVHAYRGRLEVRHEKTLGMLPWLWDRWYVVPAATPRRSLAATVAALPRGAELLLDLKGWQPWLGPAVAAQMERSALGRPYAVCSRNWRALDAFAGREHVRVVHSVNARVELARLPARLRRRPTWGVSVSRHLLTAKSVARLHRMAPVVLTWGVDDDAAVRAVLRLGVDGVISKDLRVLSRLAAGTFDAADGSSRRE